MTKTYDRSYFDRWYRDADDRVSTRDVLERKVRLAVAVTEYLLGRRLRSVLDVGCGEAPWFCVLRRLRPGTRYVGVDASEYAVARYGKSRHIRRGTVGELGRMRLGGPFDLAVCADVLQYADDREAARGLRAIRARLAGVAYIEAFVTADGMEGDLEGWHRRTAADYRRLLRQAGLSQCGPYCYTALGRADGLNVFEVCR